MGLTCVFHDPQSDPQAVDSSGETQSRQRVTGHLGTASGSHQRGSQSLLKEIKERGRSHRTIFGRQVVSPYRAVWELTILSSSLQLNPKKTSLKGKM